MGDKIGNHRGHRPTGDRLLQRPEHFGNTGDASQHQLTGIQAEPREPEPVGKADFLRRTDELQVEHPLPLTHYLLARHAKCEPEGGTGAPRFIGKDFVDQPGWHTERIGPGRPCIGFVRSRRAIRHVSKRPAILDAGDARPEGVEF